MSENGVAAQKIWSLIFTALTFSHAFQMRHSSTGSSIGKVRASR